MGEGGRRRNHLPALRALDLNVSIVDAEQPAVSQAVILAAAFLQVAGFGMVAQALPASLSSQLLSTATAERLGHLEAASALARLLLIPTCGKLVDTIGRKPLLVATPAIATAARAVMYLTGFRTSSTLGIAMELCCQFVTSITTMVWWLAYRATLADLYGHDTALLATAHSRVDAVSII